MGGMSAEFHTVIDILGLWSRRRPTGLRVLDRSDGAAKLHRNDRRICP